MSFIGNAIGDVVGGITGANQQASAAQNAAATQASAAQAGINEDQRQFNIVQGLLSPFSTAGTQALTSFGNLSGTNGAQAQQGAISQLQQSPLYNSTMQAGQNAILQNASATGGLRGGNTQLALGQLGAQTLSGLVQNQLGNFNSLIGTGESAAAGTGTAAQNTGNAVSGLLQQQGAATAGGQIAAGNTTASSINSLASLFGALPSGTAGKVGGFLSGLF